MIGWVFFRSNSPAFAAAFLKTLIGMVDPLTITPYSVLVPPTMSLWITLAIAILFSFPSVSWLERKLKIANSTNTEWIRMGVSIVLLAVSLLAIASSTFQPYIYGNF
jgi:hypothetical protein